MLFYTSKSFLNSSSIALYLWKLLWASDQCIDINVESDYQTKRYPPFKSTLSESVETSCETKHLAVDNEV